MPSHYLTQWWPSLVMHKCVIWPQYVKDFTQTPTKPHSTTWPSETWTHTYFTLTHLVSIGTMLFTWPLMMTCTNMHLITSSYCVVHGSFLNIKIPITDSKHIDFNINLNKLRAYCTLIIIMVSVLHNTHEICNIVIKLIMQTLNKSLLSFWNKTLFISSYWWINAWLLYQ